jgi:hypothetical protein
MLSCTNKIMVKDMGKFLFRVQCKWERKVMKMGIKGEYVIISWEL